MTAARTNLAIFATAVLAAACGGAPVGSPSASPTAFQTFKLSVPAD